MKIRKFHRACAITFSPLFLFSAISGSVLLFRKAAGFKEKTEEFIASLHTWEIAAPYIGLLVACGLAAVSITGIILFFKRNA